MKKNFLFLAIVALLSSCGSDDNKNKNNNNNNNKSPLVGTWKPISEEVKEPMGSTWAPVEMSDCGIQYDKLAFFEDKSAIVTVSDEDPENPLLCDTFESTDASWETDGNKLKVTFKDPENGNTVTLNSTFEFKNSNNRLILNSTEDGAQYRTTYEKK